MDGGISSVAVLEYLDKLVPCWCKLPAVVAIGRKVPSGHARPVAGMVLPEAILSTTTYATSS